MIEVVIGHHISSCWREWWRKRLGRHICKLQICQLASLKNWQERGGESPFTNALSLLSLIMEFQNRRGWGGLLLSNWRHPIASTLFSFCPVYLIFQQLFRKPSNFLELELGKIRTKNLHLSSIPFSFSIFGIS